MKSMKTRICIYFNSYFRGIKDANIKQIWNKYDDDHSGKLDVKEFIEFIKEIHLNVGSKINVEELFKKVDADHSGKIDFNEFVNYFDELTSANEFKDDYNKYSGNKGFLDIFDLIKFLFEIQNENFSIEDAIILILNYNKEISQFTTITINEKLEK